MEKPVDPKRLKKAARNRSWPATAARAPIDADRVEIPITLALLREACVQEESCVATLLAAFQASAADLMAAIEAAAVREAVDEVKRLAAQLSAAAASVCAFPLAAAAMLVAADTATSQSDLLVRLRTAWAYLGGELRPVLRPASAHEGSGLATGDQVPARGR